MPVPSGKQGLQQSTALFYHLQNLPLMMRDVFAAESKILGRRLKAVAASFKPRPAGDSYLPVFKAGATLAASISTLLGIPLVETTHQEGHLVCGLWSAKYHGGGRFLALHLSGGTTELLSVKQCGDKPLRYEINILGGSVDIPSGQLIDRIGTAMGLPFPCGAYMEKKAAEYRARCGGDKTIYLKEQCRIPSAVKGYSVSFSGAETQAKRLLQKGAPEGCVATAVESCIAASIEKMTRRAVEETGIKDVLLVGRGCFQLLYPGALDTAFGTPGSGRKTVFSRSPVLQR